VSVDSRIPRLSKRIVARDDAVCIRSRCRFVEHGILEVREVELEGLGRNRVGDWRHREHREEILELLPECSTIRLRRCP
jgi:hypothetical protein